MTAFGGSRGEIFLSRSPDLYSWSAAGAGAATATRRLVGLAPNRYRPAADRTEHGWLVIYHGVKETVAGAIYRVGLALARPRRTDPRARPGIRNGSSGRVAPYERQGDVPNAVFPCGLVHDRASGEVRLYYGAADTSICLATARLDDLLDAIEPGDNE